jgi:undecaprenyl pyrophosphate phosphatase UppP
MAAAFASGYLSLAALRKLVVGGKFYLFGFYTLIAGLIGIIFLA